LLERIEAIFAIGGGPGANRVGGSDGEQRAHDLVAGWCEEAGLRVEVDPDGNLVAARVWTGSHLDSVPNGGRFDGVLGVLAGIKADDRLVAAIGFEPSLRTEPVAMDEEVRSVLCDRVAGPELVSGAGHDAGVLAAAGVRCGMLFVRSGAGGISHAPEEWSDPEDVALCVDVLADVISRLAE
jgi:acetylornithine deacetylase/succinyl-diaminopimelate desuccinylase-like protein